MKEPAPQRRDFLKSMTAATSSAAASGWLGPGLCRAESHPPKEGDTRISVVGDLHFDRLDHHDFDWVRREHPGDIRQIENYSRITQENFPSLFEKIREVGQSRHCTHTIQVGDLVEGLCGTPELARQHCEDALDFLKKNGLPVPFSMCKGNHDITGPGSREAYREVLLPYINQSPQEAHFSDQHGRYLFVYFDAYHPASLDWFQKLMDARTPEQKEKEQLLFVVHPPVVPYNARSTWTVFGRSEAGQVKRLQLVDLLGKNQAIVLCGHLHKYCFLERNTEYGNFTQLAVSSVPYDLRDQEISHLSGLENYGPTLTDLEPRHSPDTVEQRRKALEKERPWIRRFEYADVWGQLVLHLQHDGTVEAEIFHLLHTEPDRRLRITPSKASA